MYMIKKIFLYSGINEQLFLSFVNKAFRDKFSELGLFYADNFCSITCGSKFVSKINDMCMTPEDGRLQTALRDITKEATRRQAHTLCLGIFHLRRNLHLMNNLVQACKHILPNAKLIFIVDNSLRDDIRYERFYSYITFRFYSLNYFLGKIKTDALSGDYFSDLIKYLLYTFDNKNDSIMTIKDAAALLNIDINSPHWLTKYQPFCFPIIPREVLSFAQATLVNTTLPLPPGTVFHWPGQLHRFINSDYPASPHSLLGPKRRMELLGQRRMDNAKAARLARRLGIECVFSAPEPEPDWQPFAGLDAATAFTIARHLDADFARARMAELDATPAYFLRHEQRVVQQALHDACGNTAAPLPPGRRAAPEPRLSVLTLTYNHAGYIAQNIESVLAQQTSFPVQHIIADDGSDDGTQQIILDYAARYPHIVPVLRKDRNKGNWRNVQVLFDMCRTEYAALCDGDDYFTDPAKLQTQVDFLDRHKRCALCFHVVRVVYEDGSHQESLYPSVEHLPHGVSPFYSLDDLLKCNFIQTNSVVYRWRFRNGLPEWFRPDCCPGDWYWHLLHAELGGIGFINSAMSVYRRHKNGIYYLSNIDRLKHRAMVGKEEIKVFDIINRHFNNKYESILMNYINGVFADCLMYDSQRTQDEDFSPTLPVLTKEYPDFARHFLESLKRVSAKSKPPA